jgi:hypothetical protein
MKYILIAILSLFSLTNFKAQNFEGKIMYNISYQSKTSGLKSEQLKAMMGTKQAYVIKGNNYKSAFNGTFMKLQMYRGDENRSYALTAKSDTLYWEDYATNKDKALSYEIKQSYDTVLGIPCDVIIIQAENSLTHYYFNTSYKVNPKMFSNHNYGNWYYIISKTKSLPLKAIYETDLYIMESEAIEITPMELKDNVFEIQNKSKVAKATW